MSGAFEEVVQLSGLSPIFARAVVRRCVERAGLTPERLAPREVEAVLPDLERALLPFLGKATDSQIARIRQWAKQAGR